MTQSSGLPALPFDNLTQPIWEVSPYPIAVVSFDRNPRDRKFVYVNAAFSEATGYSSLEVVGRPSTLLDGPKTSKAAIAECEAAVTRGQPTRAALIHYRKDASEYVAHVTVAPLVEPDGGAHFLIFVETMIPPNPAIESAIGRGVVVPLSLPMPLEEFPAGHLPKHLASHPELDALQELWTTLRGNRSLPQRADFDLKTVKRWARQLSIATVMPTGRFQFRLFGTELARVYGHDLTGRFLDELTPKDLWSVVMLHYEEVVRTRRPLFAPISIANGRWYSEVSRLLLPLAAESDADRVAFVMGADYPRKID